MICISHRFRDDADFEESCFKVLVLESESPRFQSWIFCLLIE